MTHTISETLFTALTSPWLLELACCALVGLAAHCGCGHCHDDDDDDSDEDDEADLTFNFSADELRDYEELVAQTNARIAELAESLDDGTASDRRETLDELTQCYLQRAARAQESGEAESATDDYAAAFARMEEYIEEFGEAMEMLKRLAAGRLNYAILLNDEGEFDDALEAYALAAETTDRLVELGDSEARLDRVGIKLNSASIIFEQGDRARCFEMLDEATDEFQALVDEEMSQSPEAYYYLAKTLGTKASLLLSTLPDDDLDRPERREARELFTRATNAYRTLVDAGHAQYKRDLADSILSTAETFAPSSRQELEETCEALEEVRACYETVLALGETDACPDLFDASIKRAEILEELGRDSEAVAAYDRLLETFGDFDATEDLPMLEGLANARLRRAVLQKEKYGFERFVAELTKAIELQGKIASDLIASLAPESDGCDHDHCEGGCDHDHCEGGCDHDHCEEGCGCGCGCGERERRFLIDRWANDNFNALMEAIYHRILAYTNEGDFKRVREDCALAFGYDSAYKKVLREGEKVESEYFDNIRRIAANLP